jgi:hypothetical protein
VCVCVCCFKDVYYKSVGSVHGNHLSLDSSETIVVRNHVLYIFYFIFICCNCLCSFFLSIKIEKNCSQFIVIEIVFKSAQKVMSYGFSGWFHAYNRNLNMSDTNSWLYNSCHLAERKKNCIINDNPDNV